MRWTRSIASSLFAVTLLTSSTISAQSGTTPSPPRTGFFASGGLGLGSAQVTCGVECSSNHANGLSLYARLDGTINSHFRVGVEANGWLRRENGVDTNLEFYSGAVYVYPSVSYNLWLKAGVGFATAKASDDVDDLEANGVGLSAAIGYDWAVTHRDLVVVPFAGYLRLQNGSAKFDGNHLGVNASVDLFEFGVGLGFRH